VNIGKDIGRDLTGGLIIDWCAQLAQQDGEFVFMNSFASGYGRIRFSTRTLEAAFPPSGGTAGFWKNGRHAFYEIRHQTGVFQVACLVGISGLGLRKQKACRQLLAAAGAEDTRDDCAVVKAWDLLPFLSSSFQEADALSDFAGCELQFFQRELRAWLDDPARRIRNFPGLELHPVGNLELPETVYMEGALKTILTDRFERNRQARRQCVAVHGTACAVCGFDFGLVYGEEFAGKIEVHHRKPLSEIREEYTVNPGEDLIPVCPNCHLILHSKAEGVFTVAEVKNFLNHQDVAAEAGKDASVVHHQTDLQDSPIRHGGAGKY